MKKKIPAKEQFHNQLEAAKTIFNGALRISYTTFAQVAAEILNIPLERIKVYKQPYKNKTLTISIFKAGDKKRCCYDLNNGSKEIFGLPVNIDGFKKTLKKSQNKHK